MAELLLPYVKSQVIFAIPLTSEPVRR